MVNLTVTANYFGWKDEYYQYLTGVVPPVVRSKIRVTFNRKLTYSEREHLRATFVDDSIKLRFEKPDMLWLKDFADDDSRELYAHVADFVERNFVNVHPVAVKTVIPEVKV
jgi:hypothetical protein